MQRGFWKMMSLMVVVALALTACGQEAQENENTIPAATPTFAGLASLPTLPGQAPTPVLPVEARDFPILPDPAGENLYNIYCAECHGVEGEGQYPDDPYAPNEQGLLGAPPHNNTGHTWHHPDPVLFRIIYQGQTASGFLPMPAFKDQLTPDQIISILAYIKIWWGEMEQEAQRRGTEAYLNQ